MEAVTIRDSTQDDVARIHEIYCCYIGTEDVATFEEEPPTEEEMAQRREHVLSQNFPFICAVTSEGVVGYAYAASFKERSAYRFSCTHSIYLDPRAQRKGAGTALLHNLLARLRGAGMKQVVAIVGTTDDNPGTHALHAKFGFMQVALLPKIGFKNNRWVDRAYLQLELNHDETSP